MTTSTPNETEAPEDVISDETIKGGGAIADILTLLRALLTPVIMFIIIKGGWPNPGTALLVSVLFIFAALTDIFDDYFGGAETAPSRTFGWFDDCLLYTSDAADD